MNITAFCSSPDAVSPNFRSQAFALGAWIASNSHTLVYRGVIGGLMNEVAKGASGYDNLIEHINKFTSLGLGKPMDSHSFHIANSLDEIEQFINDL